METDLVQEHVLLEEVLDWGGLITVNLILNSPFLLPGFLYQVIQIHLQRPST